MKLNLDPGAAALLDALHAAGYAAYAVGGCVRDSLLGRPAHDWDLCTSALPEQVVELFGAENCIPTGLQHGTVTIKQDGRLYETTTFRTEGSYTDGRHPDKVQFVPDVCADLARRDFTINAMAYNEREGLIDPFGGQSDLANGLLRAVGEPERRFEEDALRILRLYRFAARFEFAIEKETDRAAKALAQRLRCISAERIEEELTKLLAAPQPGAYLVPEVAAVILPELPPQALAAAKQVLDACPAGEETRTVRLAALLERLDECEARKVLRRLRCSNACVEETAMLLREQNLRVEQDLTLQARQLLRRYDLLALRRLCALRTAQDPANAPQYAQLLECAEQLERDGVCCRLAQLAVNGRDLMAAGISAGPELRRTLDRLLDAVIREQLPNEKHALLAAAGQFPTS